MDKTFSSTNSSTKPSGATIIASGCFFTGELKTDCDLHISGVIKGDIKSKGKVLLTPNAIIKGNVKCQHLTVNGKIEGEIDVVELEILGNGDINGIVSAKSCVATSGCSVKGIININK